MKRILLPENLNFEQILSQNPPKFKHDIEDFKYIASLIHEIPAFNKELELKNGNVPINATILQSKIRNYNEYLDYLVTNEIFETDNQFIPHLKSRGYCYTSTYQTKGVSEVLVDKKSKKYNKPKTIFDFRNDKKYEKLLKCFNSKLKIDYQGAKICLDRLLESNISKVVKNPILKYNYSLLNVEKFYHQDFAFTVDYNVNRLHNSFTSLKKELRNFVTYDNIPLVAVDVKNSQPYLSTLLLNPAFYSNNSLNINSFNTKINKSLTSSLILVNQHLCVDNEDVVSYSAMSENGTLYEYMSDEIKRRTGKKIEERRQLKEIIFTVLYSDNRFIAQVEAENKRIFRDLFPTVYKIFSNFKRKDKTLLPCLLQMMEANLILDKIGLRILKERPQFPIYTIHDSIVCLEGQQEYVASVMRDEMFKVIGRIPTLSFEPWDRNNVENF